MNADGCTVAVQDGLSKAMSVKWKKDLNFIWLVRCNLLLSLCLCHLLAPQPIREVSMQNINFFENLTLTDPFY